MRKREEVSEIHDQKGEIDNEDQKKEKEKKKKVSKINKKAC